ncbi:hypothetical protein RA307_23700 [Xanthobacteraceae bacterium Astr-EGSB]|uniref:hypothetical protein n=1 Tax=Astrobacterium formosum TaxID=3069710 RepID=UPI0027B07D55|nr:hypothetical protein [Xanthobacteraceae bacterium Astr-EGSB]
MSFEPVAGVPAHLAAIRSIVGLEEFKVGDNPAVLALASDIAAAFPDMQAYCRSYKSDATAWCGLAEAWAVMKAGIRPPYGRTDTSRFLWAAAWTTWGSALAEPRPGAILIFDHHVATLDEIAADGTLIVIGGNQSSPQGGAVTRSRRRRSEVLAMRWPPAPVVQTSPSSPSPAPTRSIMKVDGVTATIYGTPQDGLADNEPAYGWGQVAPGWADRPGVALPCRISGPRPTLTITNPATGRSVTAPVIDVGPWNKTDDWYLTGARPRVEAQFLAKTTDDYGRIPKNDAGIDLTPATAAAIGLAGKGKVDVEILAADAPAPTLPDVIAPAAAAAADVATVLARMEAMMLFALIKDDLTAEERASARQAMLARVLGAGRTITLSATPAAPAASAAPAAATPAAPAASSDKMVTGASLIALILSGLGVATGTIAPPIGDEATAASVAAVVAPLITAVAGGTGLASPVVSFGVRFLGALAQAMTATKASKS